MSTSIDFRNGLEPADHIVQLYGDDDGTLVRNVAHYLHEGLSCGGGGLVIATPDHNAAFVRQLTHEGADAAAWVQQRRLLLLDARQVLGRFMVDGQPDWERFEHSLGSIVHDLKAQVGQAPVRAYGEMVGLLWQDGEDAAAIRVEEYWNRLLRSGAFSLFCAYPIDVFGPDYDAASLDPILCAHTQVAPLNERLARAVDRALDEVLGRAAVRIRPLIRAQCRPGWGVLSEPESIVLWLRSNLSTLADQILDRARQYDRESRPTPGAAPGHEH